MLQTHNIYIPWNFLHSIDAYFCVFILYVLFISFSSNMSTLNNVKEIFWKNFERIHSSCVHVLCILHLKIMIYFYMGPMAYRSRCLLTDLRLWVQISAMALMSWTDLVLLCHPCVVGTSVIDALIWALNLLRLTLLKDTCSHTPRKMRKAHDLTGKDVF